MLYCCLLTVRDLEDLLAIAPHRLVQGWSPEKRAVWYFGKEEERT
jgi:hypothetical protein